MCGFSRFLLNYKLDFVVLNLFFFTSDSKQQFLFLFPLIIQSHVAIKLGLCNALELNFIMSEIDWSE